MLSHSLSGNGDKSLSSTWVLWTLSPHPLRPTVIIPLMLPFTDAARSYDQRTDASSPHWFLFVKLVILYASIARVSINFLPDITRIMSLSAEHAELWQ